MSKYKKQIILFLLIIELCSVYLTFSSFTNKDIDKIKEVSKIDKKLFAMFLEQPDGSYLEYNGGNYFSIAGYELNLEKSSCVDIKGNLIENALSLNGKKITISGNKSTYCYLYFRKSSLVPISEYLMENPTTGLTVTEQEGGLYRYQGSVANNYVCFGTNSKSECLLDQDKYLYRIIGIDSNNQLKLIKYSQISIESETTDSEGNRVTTNFYGSFSSNKVGTELNGDFFLNNEDYVPQYWNSSIVRHSWKTGGLDRTKFTFGGTGSRLDMSAEDVYSLIQEATESSFSIGIIQLYDYLYGKKGGCDSLNGECNSNWIYNPSYASEYTLEYFETEYSYGIERSKALIYSDSSINGEVSIDNVNYSSPFYLRPTFYLDSNTKYFGGTGTSSNPFLLKLSPFVNIPSKIQITGATTGSYNYETYGEVSCTSSDTSVATCTVDAVNNKIIITGDLAGTTNITVTSTSTDLFDDGTQVIAFTVFKPSPNLNISDTSLGINASSTFEYIRGENVSCTSSDSTIAKCVVDESSKKVTVTGLAAGTATITVNFGEGRNYASKVYSAKITVSASKVPPVINISNSSVTIGNTKSFSYTTDGEVSCTSSTSATLCTVDKTNKKINITGLSAGTATVTVTSAEGESYSSGSASATFTVSDSSTGSKVSTFNGSNASLSVGGSSVIKVTSGGTVSCVSSDSTIVDCYYNSMAKRVFIEALSEGTATVTVVSTGDATYKSGYATYTIVVGGSSDDEDDGPSGPLG